MIERVGVAMRVRRYLEDPPTPEEVAEVLEALGVEPGELVRWKEPLARELTSTDGDLERDEWLRLLSEHPILIERPIVLRSDGRAVVGRPPENVRALLP